jgi:SAM-dependent methyltransferase
MTDSIVEQVQSKYAAVAASSLSTAHAGVRAVAEAFGYTPEELASIPAEANMGLSCGNPTAFARLRPGETVVDLGCGGGLDVLLAAAKVGPTGKAIGIDMTPEMIERARQNVAKSTTGPARGAVEFHQATLDRLPLPSNSVDCLISNCVINLVPEKRVVFREMFRVLKPGGRVAVSDIALKKPLPEDVSQNILAYIGCLAGAVLIGDYERGLRDAGFGAVQIVDTHKDLNIYTTVEDQAGCCSPAMSSSSELHVTAPSDSAGCCGATSTVHESLAELLRKYDVNEYAASVQVYALKSPASAALST